MATINTLVSNASFGLGLLASSGQQVDVIGIYANGAQTGLPQNNSLGSSVLDSITGVTNNTTAFGQKYPNARPMKATIRETSKVMEHPVEVGITIADHHIINPIEIEIPFIISSEFYSATYIQMRQDFLNATALSVKTRVGVYSDMIIADMPHEEDADMYDVITVSLRLRQVIYVTSFVTLQDSFAPIDPLNSDTSQNGLQQAAAIGGKLLTAGTAVASYANLGKIL